MASSYVNDLRLNEMATGDASGSWGTNTNVNLELIGEGLGYGTEGITTNANTHTSTVADGATDPVRAMYVEYTGTLDSACTITIAPNTINRMHFIENGTSGSQNIIIKQGSGATITIPPGDTKAVYLDGAGSGAAVVDAFASLSVVDLKVQDDLTVTDDVAIGGLATVGGTLAVTGIVTLTDDLIIGDGKTIGSASDVDAMTIASNGQITLTQTLIGTALDISGDIDVDGVTNLDNTDIDGTLDVSGQVTFADGSAGAPSISNTGDVNAGLFFSAADVMSFSAGGTAQFTMADGSISPVTDNDIDLGTASLKYKSFFAGLVDAENFKVNGGQGSDGQVLTSTGSGVAFEDAGGGPTFKVFGTSSIMVGDDATGTINAANFNTALGVDVFAALTSADENTMVGFSAGKGITTGGSNVGVGVNTFLGTLTGGNNVAIGLGVLAAATSGFNNTAVGTTAMGGVVTGRDNTCIGFDAGDVITSGQFNTFVGSQSGELTTTANDNTGVGGNAMAANVSGAKNSALGFNALAANTTGPNSTAVGYGALASHTTAGNNTAVGYQAGDAITTGDQGVYIGQDAGGAGTTGTNTVVGAVALTTQILGTRNTALGYGAMQLAGGDGSSNLLVNNTAVGHQAMYNHDKDDCTAVGMQSLFTMTSGTRNVALGGGAGYAITSGADNITLGVNAGNSITTGANNVAVGKDAMDAVTTGDSNICIGKGSAISAVDTDGEITIGFNTGGNGSNSFTVGFNGTETRFPTMGATTVSASSDERLKNNITTSSAGLSFINALRPVTYKWKNKGDIPSTFKQYTEGSTESYNMDSTTKHGFIAQEVKAALDSHSEVKDGQSIWDIASDGTQSIGDSGLIPMLVKALQEADDKIDALTTRITTLEG